MACRVPAGAVRQGERGRAGSALAQLIRYWGGAAGTVRISRTGRRATGSRARVGGRRAGSADGSCRHANIRGSARPTGVTRGPVASGVCHRDRAAIIPRLPALSGTRFVVMKRSAPKAETVKRDWYVVDATNKTLGRLCSGDRASSARQAQDRVHSASSTPAITSWWSMRRRSTPPARRWTTSTTTASPATSATSRAPRWKDMLATHPERVIGSA